MTLKRYRSKRDTDRSKEPSGKKHHHKKNKPLQFVIQKHAARRLHYDLRLEADGVLKSWAVPKGPSLNPEDKRLAIMVEDHPYDYKDFEGIIPEGYGKGTVGIWDKGIYYVDNASPEESEKEILRGLQKGEIHFTLEGERLKGTFLMVRIEKSDKNEWLLMKKRERPRPISPMLATLVDQPFDSDAWVFEIKWDGFRAIAEVNHSKVDLYSRSQLSFNDRFPEIVSELQNLKVDAIFDGEIVVLDEEGKSHFQLLQNYRKEKLKDKTLCYYVFDLLYLNGEDLRSLTLMQRKKILRGILKDRPNSAVRYLDHIEKEGKKFFQICAEHGLEGVIGKLKESPYSEGKRTKEWVKIKTHLRQEAIICGFTQPKGGRKNLGALIIGVYRNGTLEYAGHVGGGFTVKKLKEVKEQLTPYIQKASPFKNPPKTNTAVTWLTPHFLCEVEFREWTQEGSMRQPIFLGIREDKPAKKVMREKPTHVDKIYWPKDNITKGELIDYYEQVSSYILPYLKDRPVSLKRYPEGIEGESFFQKNWENLPENIQTAELQHTSKKVRYLLIQDKKSLLYAVNLGCIEIHPFFSKIQTLEYPDFFVFDLDPEECSFDKVIETAQTLHNMLEEIGVPSVCKTSGATGLHICIPLHARYTYEQAKLFTQLVASLVHQRLPKITSLERSPKNRREKVYIDCFQNNLGQTISAPYSVRARPKAPVSAPLEWNEVKKGLSPLSFTIQTMPGRLKKTGDLFKMVRGKGINLNQAIKKLESFFAKS